MSNASVIIVGAGIAGIASGAKLLENGINNIILLEAEDRIGGRICTIPFGANHIDLGAQWCHGEEGNVVYEMVEAHEMLSETDVSAVSFARSDGKPVDERHCKHLMALCTNILEEASDELATYQGNLGDFFEQKYRDAIREPDCADVDPELAKLILEVFQRQQSAYFASDTMFEISGYGYTKFKECPGSHMLNWKDKGYGSIVDFVTKKRPHVDRHLNVEAKVLTGKEVSNIDWSRSADENVTVKCSDGSVYRADHVIVTASVGVLKANYKEMFTPQLPRVKSNAIEGIGFGKVQKVFLEFDEPWWPEDWTNVQLLWTKADVDEIKSTENAWLESILGFYTVDYQPNVLCGWIYGAKVSCTELMDDDTVINGCMFVFEKFLSKQMNFRRPINVQTTRWATNKHFLGTYSYHSIKTDLLKTSSEALAQPIYNPLGKPCVLFAGEATHPHYFGMVHGAIETGYREAERILRELQ